MSPALELKNIIDYLDESKTMLLLEIAKLMLPNENVVSNDDDDYYIKQAELEYANGEMLTWKDINWKQPLDTHD